MSTNRSISAALALIVLVGLLPAACAPPSRDIASDGRGDAREGRELAVAACSECHVVVRRQVTHKQVDDPADFVEIANAPGMTRTSLYVFLHRPHPSMPNLVLSDRESADVIAYILTLADGR